ncbi:hypothetical protein Tco_1401131 [Tanacetum coccineum]
MLRGTPVISAGFQAKISKFCLSKEHSSLRPFSVNVDPMATSVQGTPGDAMFIFRFHTRALLAGALDARTSEDGSTMQRIPYAQKSAHFKFNDHWPSVPSSSLKGGNDLCCLPQERSFGNPTLGPLFPLFSGLDHFIYLLFPSAAQALGCVL